MPLVIQSREQQRARHSFLMAQSLFLECHLRNLIRQIRAGEAAKLVEFQQFVQYAPENMRLRVQTYLEDTK